MINPFRRRRAPEDTLERARDAATAIVAAAGRGDWIRASDLVADDPYPRTLYDTIFEAADKVTIWSGASRRVHKAQWRGLIFALARRAGVNVAVLGQEHAHGR